MALDYLSVFTNSRYSVYYTLSDGRLLFPVITGMKKDPRVIKPKRVVRIPPTYGSGAYYSRQAYVEGNAYVSIETSNPRLCPSPCMECTTPSGTDKVLYMYSDGVTAECYRLASNGMLYYWFIKYVTSYFHRGRVYFTYEYYQNSARSHSVETYMSQIDVWRCLPRSTSSSMAAAATRLINANVDVSGDDWLEPFLWHNITGCLDAPFSVLAETAYVGLVDNLPQTTVNTVGNVIEIASSLNNLRKGKIMPRTARDAWLAYRYSYNTSKADIQEYIDLTKRLMYLPKLPDITVHSSVVYDDVTCRCTAVMSCESIIPSSTAQWLSAYGMKLNAANAWDLLPYSFVADWFLHIGDFLQEVDRVGEANTLKPKEVWYSFRKTRDGVTTYFRVKGNPRKSLPLFGVTNHKASGKTICYRIADSVALFTS